MADRGGEVCGVGDYVVVVCYERARRSNVGDGVVVPDLAGSCCLCLGLAYDVPEPGCRYRTTQIFTIATFLLKLEKIIKMGL